MRRVGLIPVLLVGLMTVTMTDGRTQEPAPGEDYAGGSLISAENHLFMGADGCSVCHTGMTDSAGADISFDEQWRATTHANAARDPYWQASVRAETLANPALREVIEDKCVTCHMPMARTTVVAQGEQGRLLDDGLGNPEHPLHGLAMDGVSCTVCHQIQARNLGQEESFDGRFLVDTTAPLGERASYGPYETAELDAMMMGASGYLPVTSDHLGSAELCATCHTLSTPFVDVETREVAGMFPEQMPYREWLASDHAPESVCQTCHMLEVDGEVSISPLSDMLRPNVSRHDIGGGNSYILRILRHFGEELGVTASSEVFDATAQAVDDHLRAGTAVLSIGEMSSSDGTLSADVVVQSNAGHKFPTGFPSRRVWLHVRVYDGVGNVLFESGDVNPDGSIVGNDNDADGTVFEPHYTTIEQADQVQIYETILADTADAVTTTLLLGSRYIKDNRLLPAGFDKTVVGDDIAVRGAAFDDEDFAGGGDRVRYQVPVGDAVGPFTLTAAVLYQSIGYRWAQNLSAFESDETSRFLRYYATVPNPGVVVTHTSATTTP